MRDIDAAKWGLGPFDFPLKKWLRKPLALLYLVWASLMLYSRFA